MTTHRVVPVLVLIVALLAPGASASPAQPTTSPTTPAPASAPVVPGDEYWAAGYHQPGVDGGVSALVVAPDGSVYAGGTFTTAGGVEIGRASCRERV